MSEVLETMYFMSPLYRGETIPDPDSFGAEVRFTGQISGQFTLRVSRHLARTMAGEFLACEELLLMTEQVEAAVLELANVACGTCMSAWMPDANFEYGVPLAVPPSLKPVTHSFSVASDHVDMFLCVTTLD